MQVNGTPIPPSPHRAQLREAGLAAEENMFMATDGVNTHKGAIYILGLLCGSIGRLWLPEAPIAEIKAITAECASIVSASAVSDFATADNSTAGLRLYRKYGIKGVRGEAAAGFPSALHIGLPAYKEALSKGLSQNHTGVIALLHLIAQVPDTNLYHRGGCAGARWAAESAQTLLRATPYPSIQQVEALDDAFIRRNLSPGGCADLLAVTFFLHRLNP
jgi:holo-ACP synthase/triphosphoribosyl-dephospho-CoA synthase